MTGSASAQTVTIATPPYASPPAPTTDVAVFSEAPSGSLSFAGTLDLLAANNHNLMKFRREEERRIGDVPSRSLTPEGDLTGPPGGIVVTIHAERIPDNRNVTRNRQSNQAAGKPGFLVE